jgi:Delta24(24(1))-sterol reductase
MALCWGLACGFSSFLPYFYPLWLTIVLLHRATRDIEHCRKKYGEEWKEYERLCPYLFIPVFFPLLYDADWSMCTSVFISFQRFGEQV